MNLGSRVWVFPDGDLPPRDPYDPALKRDDTHGHESLIVLNAGTKPVLPTLRIYFSDTEPLTVALPAIGAQRVQCFRLDEALGSDRLMIPQGQYALLLKCDRPVVAQIGRMDIRQTNLAYYTVMGFPGGK